MSPMLLLPCFLFLFGFICTFSKIPPSKKLKLLLSLFSHDLKNPIVAKEDDDDDRPHPDERRIADLRGVFATFDKNSDGYVTKEELGESLRNIGISAGEEDVAEMVRRADSNEDGLIDFAEFCHLLESVTAAAAGDGDLREAFDVFDGNGDGLVTVEELGLVLSSLGFSEGKKIEACKEMIRRVDSDGDGMVNFDEFKVMMKYGLVNKLS